MALTLDDDLFPTVSKVLTVAELTRQIRGTLETKFGAVWVQGEISNYKLHPSGHQYFTLKDQRAQISCVIFRNTLPPAKAARRWHAGTSLRERFRFRSARPISAQCPDLADARRRAFAGEIRCTQTQTRSRRSLRSRDASARCRNFQRRIGIVTSPSGAAIRDMLNVLRAGAPGLEILINPVRVQGFGAAAEIAVAIREMTLRTVALAAD